jgi:DNA invertase Pin-like site-specific DNA recombinase
MSRIRCAIYTRKSSEEGLDQTFNSLHAQREACEAYVRSQAGEGWKALAAPYDDGGFSGGSMERPALQQLLSDVTAGKIDVVVVYKIDRLTRSLTDFARIVEIFDSRKVSFVSITQAFNTTTSMGRLTLNVLLSFAQFEREVTAERIRDKIAASKAKGMWMGGLPPLGYDPPTDRLSRTLVVNPTEAETVRLIFQRYLELGSVHALRDWLEAQQIRSKRLTTLRGRQRGGQPFSRGALFHLLRNKLYVGVITHRGAGYPGAHPPIIEAEVFDEVQLRLDANARRHAQRETRVASAPLKGRIFDADGKPMSPSFGHGARGQVYRYYVSAPLQQGRRPRPDGPHRVSGPVIEGLLVQILSRLCPTVEQAELLGLPLRVEVHRACLHLLLPIAWLPKLKARLEPGEEIAPEPTITAARLIVPASMRRRGGRSWIDSGCAATAATRSDPTLIRALRAAHGLIAYEGGEPIMAAAPATPYLRQLVCLALLAPDLQAAILAGRQPIGMTIERLMMIAREPLWADQKRLFAA